MPGRLVLPTLLALTPFALSAQEPPSFARQAPARPLTEDRVAALPAAERAAWTAYLRRSRSLAAADRAALSAERATGGAVPPVGHGPSGGGGMPLDRPPSWYGGPEAGAVAANIVSFQTPAGGWGKNQDRSGPPRRRGQGWVSLDVPGATRDIAGDAQWAFVGTLDNDATTTEMRFLARVQAALPDAKGDAARASFLKGLRYLLDAQYPNGGWPQVYPLQGGYHDAVTFNDDAVAEVAELMFAAGAGTGDYAFVPADLRARARAAGDRTVAAVLAAQVRVGGRRTIWGQQHDALTLAPVGARTFEPRSLSSAESSGLLLFLMRRYAPSPALRGAVEDGVAWLRTHELRDVTWGRVDGENRLTPSPGAGPLWARLYDPESGRPVFGDRDGRVVGDVNAISRERRNGYSWFNTQPAKVFAAYDRWRASARRRTAKRPA